MTLTPDLSEGADLRSANARFLFLRLWTKADDGPRYDKVEWILLGGSGNARGARAISAPRPRSARRGIECACDERSAGAAMASPATSR